MPRYRASVPMVTASDGSPTRVTSSPLSRPPSAPTTATITKISRIGSLCRYSTPSRALDIPSIDSTDRSISPLMMIRAIGSVMIAISPVVRPRLKKLFDDRNCGETLLPNSTIATTTTTRPVSQRSAGLNRAGRTRARSSSSSTAGAPPSQGRGQLDRDDAVQHNGQDQQGARDRLVPVGRDAEHVQGRVDRLQQPAADGRAHHAAAAAEDGHPADAHRRHHLQFVAGPGGVVEGAVA